MKIINEKQLQATIVIDFSQKRPEERGRLFAVNNEASNNRHAMALKALGVHKGVSDLIYFSNGRLMCLEIKLPGKKHKASHIKSQYDWGVEMEKNGAVYLIVTSLESFWKAVDYNYDNGVYDIEDINELLSEGKKTIIF